MDKRKAKLTIQQMVLFGVLGALTSALQVVMGPLPNIEPVSLLVMLFAVTFGWKGDYSIPVVKLVLIVLLAISGISAVVMLVSRIVERQRERKLRREREKHSMDCYNAYCPEYYDPDFLPF